MNTEENKLSKKREKSILELLDDAAASIDGSQEKTQSAHEEIELQLFSRLQRIGLNAIDRQHETLVRHLCNLYKVMVGIRLNGPTLKEDALLKITLDGLTEYTVKHFQEEENYMVYIGYPESDNHAKIHKEFLAKFLEIRNKIQESNSHLVNDLFFLVYKWLFDHINREDAKIATFYKP
ncbi:MAG: hemerythrin family protein [Magnetococcales bacterium]|nr:hemerythrin family protein [Magnetococcales bacterium]